MSAENWCSMDKSTHATTMSSRNLASVVDYGTKAVQQNPNMIPFDTACKRQLTATATQAHPMHTMSHEPFKLYYFWNGIFMAVILLAPLASQLTQCLNQIAEIPHFSLEEENVDRFGAL